MDQARAAAQRLHDAAVARGDRAYTDPRSGLFVMTALHHRQRGFCCGAGCRHCPYSLEEQAAAGRPEGAPCWERRG